MVEEILYIALIFIFSMICFWEARKTYNEFKDMKWSEAGRINGIFDPKELAEEIIFNLTILGIGLIVVGIVCILMFVGVVSW